MYVPPATQIVSPGDTLWCPSSVDDRSQGDSILPLPSDRPDVLTYHSVHNAAGVGKMHAGSHGVEFLGEEHAVDDP